MAQQIQLFRRRIPRAAHERHAWRVVRRSHVRVALQALEALYRKA